jgi:hypothetical protein
MQKLSNSQARTVQDESALCNAYATRITWL